MEEIKSFKYIYFLYSIEKNKNLEITSFFQVKKLITFDKIDTKNISFNLNIYNIKIDMTKLEKDEKNIIKIQLINNDNKFTYDCSIDISGKSKNIYIYDIEFKKLNNFISLFNPNPPQPYNLNIDEKYEIFKKICKIDVDEENEKENDNERKMEDLIYYTQMKLKNEKKYNFSLFASILNDISQKNDITKLIELFDIDKIIFDDKKIKFKLYFSKVILYLKYLLEKNDENKIYHALLCILLLLNKYAKNSLETIFFHKKVDNYIYIKYFQKIKKGQTKKNYFPI